MGEVLRIFFGGVVGTMLLVFSNQIPRIGHILHTNITIGLLWQLDLRTFLKRTRYTPADMQQLLCSSFTGLAVRSDGPSVGLRQSQKKNVAPIRRAVSVKASIVAEPATLDVKSVDGKSAGTAALSLRVADPDSSKGLVHRYVVMIRQNMRQVCPWNG